MIEDIVSGIVIVVFSWAGIEIWKHFSKKREEREEVEREDLWNQKNWEEVTLDGLTIRLAPKELHDTCRDLLRPIDENHNWICADEDCPNRDNWDEAKGMYLDYWGEDLTIL